MSYELHYSNIGDRDKPYRHSVISSVARSVICGLGPYGYIVAMQEPPRCWMPSPRKRDVLAVLSNCPQMHNPCNGYNPTPIQVVMGLAARQPQTCAYNYRARARTPPDPVSSRSSPESTHPRPGSGR